MELTMTSGFCELSENEMMAVDGGVNWLAVGVGVVGLVVVGAIIVSTAGAAGAVVGVVISKGLFYGGVATATASYAAIGGGIVFG